MGQRDHPPRRTDPSDDETSAGVYHEKRLFLLRGGSDGQVRRSDPYIECTTRFGCRDELVVAYGVDGAHAEELLGYDDDEDDDEDEEGAMVAAGDESDDDGMGGGPRRGEDYNQFKTRIRLQETQRAEKLRRPGGVKTQQAMVKAWAEFCATALNKGDIQDDIIDEHHLLLFIKYCSERPK
ncbi:hypothetical protein D9613_012156 [Agrocybe pediades]|uniref:Uncharacterized protein n=1 Tax=Agrocybe pediades TaxID=84607 RepID=A0A8H4R3P7_9AGAR|nr:hypothetical protein D9613_012156 [Agrocybe pediades]